MRPAWARHGRGSTGVVRHYTASGPNSATELIFSHTLVKLSLIFNNKKAHVSTGATLAGGHVVGAGVARCPCLTITCAMMLNFAHHPGLCGRKTTVSSSQWP